MLWEALTRRRGAPYSFPDRREGGDVWVYPVELFIEGVGTGIVNVKKEVHDRLTATGLKRGTPVNIIQTVKTFKGRFEFKIQDIVPA